MSTKNKNFKTLSKENVRILSLDGGGIRGVFEVHFLNKLEEHLNIKMCDFFDLITGTSTGGIIALGLSIGLSAKEIERFYTNNKELIFQTNILRKLSNGIFISKYSNKSLVLKLKEIFGENLMKDAKTKLCIPSVDHSKCKTKIYKTPHNINIKEDDPLEKMWEVALSTSAAPIYFPPSVINNSYMLDGGLWANNPSLIGIIEAFKNGFTKDEIKILSLGNGSNVYNLEDNSINSGGLLGYGANVVDLVSHIQSNSISYMCNQLVDNNFLRINFTDDKKVYLDDISNENISYLIKKANDYFNKNILNIKCLFNI